MFCLTSPADIRPVVISMSKDWVEWSAKRNLVRFDYHTYKISHPCLSLPSPQGFEMTIVFYYHSLRCHFDEQGLS